MSVKKDANKREAKLAIELGMNKTINSGAIFGDGDVSDDLFLVDEKFTCKGSISLKLSDLQKIDEQAFNSSPCKIPVAILNINGYRKAVIDIEDFKEYRKYLLDNL